MTAREWMQKHKPEQVDRKYAGGVELCPGSPSNMVPEMAGVECCGLRCPQTKLMNELHCSDEVACGLCWDQEIPDAEPGQKKVIYISGPITGVEEYWKPFEEAEEELRAAGVIPLSPAHLPEGMSKKQYMLINFASIDAADAVLLLPGWINSDGASLEARYCDYVKKPMATSMEKLKEVLADEV